jgi:glutathionyl-hydroquinone reductase
MKKLISVLIFAIIAFATYNLLFIADMTWDKNTKKIVPQDQNTTIEEFDLNYKVAIDDLPAELVKKMKNQAIIHRAVAEALEENGFSDSEKVIFVNHEEDEHGGVTKLYFIFGKYDNEIIYNVVDKAPTTYKLIKKTIVE